MSEAVDMRDVAVVGAGPAGLAAALALAHVGAVVAASVSGIALDGSQAVLTLSDGAKLSARLVAGADGRRSICRSSAGIEVGFADALSERLGGLLGAISDVGARAEFPVAGLTANRLAAKRTVLLGEAAHILPPIGAQGLNLGFRDAGGEDVLDAYARARRLDVMTRTLGVDLLSGSLLTSLPPLQAARGIVLHGLKALPPLRRAVMRLGLTPPTELPSLMRPASG